MASQKFPVSKDECIKLTTNNKGAGDTDLQSWMNNHATSSSEQARVSTGNTKETIGAGVVKTKAMAISLDAISTNKEIINVQAALMAFYEGPAAPDTTQATGSSGITIHPYLKENPADTINFEVGTRIDQGTDLITLSSSINRNKNAGIQSIDGYSTPGDSRKVAEASVVCGEYASGGSYTDDTPSSAAPVGNNGGSNIATYLTVGSTDNISNSATVKAAKNLFVTPSATTQGRVRVVVEGDVTDHSVIMGQATVSGQGKGIFHGYNKNIEIAATAQTKTVETKTLNMKYADSKTYYVGTGYRKWFCGTITTNDPTNVKAALKDNGCRSGGTNVVVKGNDKVTNGSTQQGNINIDKKYFWIAIPATKELTSFSHKDVGMAENQDNFVQLPGTISVNGANEQFATDYKVYMIANSNDAIIAFSVSEYIKFNIQDPQN